MEESDKVDTDHAQSEAVLDKTEEDTTSTIIEDDVALSNLNNMSKQIETEDNKKIDEPLQKTNDNATDTKPTEETTNVENKTIDEVIEEKIPEIEDKELKSMSREFKSLIDSSKESKFISESTQIKSKMRKSRKDLLDISQNSVNTSIDERKENSRRSSVNSLQSNSSELSFDRTSAKRSMRSQNPEFLSKHRKFLNSVSGKMLKKANSDSPQSSSESEYSGDEDTNDESNSSSHRKSESHTKKKKDKTQTNALGSPEDSEESVDRSDKFCWRCHRQLVSGQPASRCSVCPRSYHSRCLGGGAGAARGGDGSAVGWVCPECLTVLHAENTDTRSPSMRKVSLSMLCELLKFALKRLMDVNGVEPFLHAVDSSSFPEYGKYVVRPMDLARLKANISAGLYGSTEAFHADTKWILHNCIIFNSVQSRLTSGARALVRACRKEMSEIEACPECYAAAHARRPTWFTDACNNPHILLWAKLKGFPYWPAKGMSVNLSTGLVDARFFGAHDRAWVQVRDCFLYCTKDPNPNNKKRQDIADSVREVQQHIRNLTNKFGTFIPAPFRTPYEPAREQDQLRMMIPGYQGMLPLMPMFKARDSDIITNAGRTIRTYEKTVSQAVAKVTSTGSNASSKDSFLEGYGTEDDETMEVEPAVSASRTMADGNRIAADEGTENASDTAGEKDKIADSVTLISSEASTPEKPDIQNRKRRQSALEEVYTITVMDSSGKRSKPTTTESDTYITDSPTEVQLVEEDPLRISPDDIIHNGPVITNIRTLQQTDQVKNISENSQDANLTDTTSIFKVTKSQENLTNMKEAMEKLRELRKKTESVITDKKASPFKEKVTSPVTGNTTPLDKSKIGTIEVRSFAKIGNNTNETKKTDSDVIELTDVQVKSEPTDSDDVEYLSVQLAAEKTNLLNSLQLQPSMISNKNNESSKTSDDIPPLTQIPGKPQVSVLKKIAKNAVGKNAINAMVLSPIAQAPNRHITKKNSGMAAVKQAVNKVSSPTSNTLQKSVLDTFVNKKNTPDGNINKKNAFEVNSYTKNVFDTANAKNTMVYIPFMPNNGDAGNQTVSINGSPKQTSVNKIDGFVKIAPRLAALKESIAEGAKKLGGEGTAAETSRGAASGVGMATTSGSSAKVNSAVSVSATETPMNLNSIAVTIAPTSLPPNTNALPAPSQLYHGVPIIMGLHSAGGQTLVNGETVVAASGSGAPASSNTVQRQAPPLQPKPQLVGSNPFDTGPGSSDLLLMSAAGPTHKMLNDHAVKIGDYFRKLMEESLESLSNQGNLQATVRTLQLALEASNWKHKQEMVELVHNTDLVLSEIRASLEGEKQRALHEVRLQCELDKIAAVNEAKTKQWCAQCWQEAQFYCCWNTAYCGYQCQQTHWHQHILSCCQADSNTQGPQDSTDSAMANGKISEESQSKSNVVPSTRVMLRTYGQTSTRGPILTVGPRGSIASSKPSNTIIVNMPTTHVSSAGNMRLVGPQHVYSPSANIIYKQVVTNNDLDKGSGNKMPGLMLVSSVNTITSCKTASPTAKPSVV